MNLSLVLRKIFRIILIVIFRVDWWHASLLYHRPYARDIISELNKRPNRGSILELGCGLGEIIGNARYQKRYFFDVSVRVLRAARFLQIFSFRDSLYVYKVFDLLEDTVDEKIKFDSIVLVNFTHGYDRKDLYPRLERLINFNLNRGGVLIFDVIRNNPAYKNNHAISDLIGVDKFRIEVLDGYRFGRKVVIATLI